MIIIAIILLVLFGVLLIGLEFFVVPGITIAGIGGLVLLFVSVYLSYNTYGAYIGNIVLAGNVVFIIALLIFAFRADTWNRLSLKAEIDGKTNTHAKNIFHVGDTGFAITRLAPMGKVEVNDVIIESKSTGAFIDENTEIEIVKVLRNKLIVKSKTN